MCFPPLNERLSSFFSFKDSYTPSLLCSYCFKYPSCNARYYGKTSRNLAIPCGELIGIPKTGHRINNNNSSAVYNHSSTTHPVSPEDFSIISNSNNSTNLLIHESLLILRDRPTLKFTNALYPAHAFLMFPLSSVHGFSFSSPLSHPIWLSFPPGIVPESSLGSLCRFCLPFIYTALSPLLFTLMKGPRMGPKRIELSVCLIIMELSIIGLVENRYVLYCQICYRLKCFVDPVWL